MPNPPFAISLEITLRAAWADVKASVLWLSRLRTLYDRESSDDTIPSNKSMIVIAIMSSISENPAADLGENLFLIT